MPNLDDEGNPITDLKPKKITFNKIQKGEKGIIHDNTKHVFDTYGRIIDMEGAFGKIGKATR